MTRGQQLIALTIVGLMLSSSCHEAKAFCSPSTTSTSSKRTISTISASRASSSQLTYSNYHPEDHHDHHHGATMANSPWGNDSNTNQGYHPRRQQQQQQSWRQPNEEYSPKVNNNPYDSRNMYNLANRYNFNSRSSSLSSSSSPFGGNSNFYSPNLYKVAPEYKWTNAAREDLASVKGNMGYMKNRMKEGKYRWRAFLDAKDRYNFGRFRRGANKQGSNFANVADNFAYINQQAGDVGGALREAVSIAFSEEEQQSARSNYAVNNNMLQHQQRYANQHHGWQPQQYYGEQHQPQQQQQLMPAHPEMNQEQRYAHQHHGWQPQQYCGEQHEQSQQMQQSGQHYDYHDHHN